MDEATEIYVFFIIRTSYTIVAEGCVPVIMHTQLFQIYFKAQLHLCTQNLFHIIENI